LPVAGSTWTTGFLAPGGLVDKDRSHDALRVRFTTDDEVDASEGGGGRGGEGGGDEAGRESIMIYLIGNVFLLKIKDVKRLHKLEIWKI